MISTLSARAAGTQRAIQIAEVNHELAHRCLLAGCETRFGHLKTQRGRFDSLLQLFFGIRLRRGGSFGLSSIGIPQ